MPSFSDRYMRGGSVDRREADPIKEFRSQAGMLFWRMTFTATLFAVSTQESVCPFYYGNKESAIKAVAADCERAVHIPPEFLQDPNFVKELIEIEDINISKVLPKYANNSDWVLQHLGNPIVGLVILNHVSDELLSDLDFINRAMEIHPGAAIFANSEVILDENFKEKDKAVWGNANYFANLNENNIHKLRYAYDSLKSNAEFMLEKMKVNPKAFFYCTLSLRKENTSLTKMYLLSIGVTEEEVDELIEEMRSLNIYYPERFTLTDLKRIIWNRKNVKKLNPNRITVSVFNQADHNATFVDNEIHDLLVRGNQVLYFEGENDTDVINEILAQELGKGSVRFAEFAGHGGGTYIRLGKDGSDTDYKKHSIDTGDLEQLRLLGSLFAPGCTIVLSSCYAGIGGVEGDNLANIVAQAIPHCQIISSEGSPSIADYRFTLTGEVKEVDFGFEKNTYVIEPYQHFDWARIGVGDLLAQAEN